MAFSNTQLVDTDLSTDFAQTNTCIDRSRMIATTQRLARNESWRQLGAAS